MLNFKELVWLKGSAKVSWLDAEFSFIPSGEPIWTRTVKLLSSRSRHNDRVPAEDKMEVSQLHLFKVKYINTTQLWQGEEGARAELLPPRRKEPSVCRLILPHWDKCGHFWCEWRNDRSQGRTTDSLKARVEKPIYSSRSLSTEHRSRIRQVHRRASVSTDIGQARMWLNLLLEIVPLVACAIKADSPQIWLKQKKFNKNRWQKTNSETRFSNKLPNLTSRVTQRHTACDMNMEKFTGTSLINLG